MSINPIRFRQYFVAAAICLSSLPVPQSVSAANLVLNPSFETNIASTTTFNMSNAHLTATVSNVTGFGVNQEVDLTKLGGNAFFGVPEDGDWFLSLHTLTTGADRDAISILLSSPLVAGTLYDLFLYATGREGDQKGVDIGVSTASTAFGSSVFSSTSYNGNVSAWTQLTTTFSSPINATYLTVMSGTTSDALVSIDNFSCRRMSFRNPARSPS
jgi:hypothetical protein